MREATKRGMTGNGLTVDKIAALGCQSESSSFEERAAAHQVDVVKGLIAMRQAGLLKRVHAHENLLAIELPLGGERRITWVTAERLVQEFRARAHTIHQPIPKKPAAAASPTIAAVRTGKTRRNVT